MTQPRTGYLHWVLPAMLALVALTVLVSGRDLSRTFADLAYAGGDTYSHPLVVWGQRAVSLLILGVCAERILAHLVQRQRLPSPVLAGTFLLYWLATVAATSLLAAHPQMSHEYLYPLVIAGAALMATEPQRDQVVDAVRNALFAFVLASVLMIPISPSMTLDLSYNQGLIPGLPRLGGLAPHPVALGMFVQTFLLCLWCRPFGRTWINVLAWVAGLAVLVLAQSKTAWIAFVICSIALLAVRNGPGTMRRLADPRENTFGIVLCVGFIAVVGAVMAVVLLGNVEAQASTFLDSAEGAQLVSLTGRDQIWAVALEEWRENPVFGYGPSLWDEAFRLSIGMPQATHGHNQFVDTLARSGTVGGLALVLYSLVLLVLSLRYARASGGLSLALFLALALRSISEVPLLLFGYGTELFVHLLLIITLASAAAGRQQAAPERSRAAYRVASSS